jgi:uncharacterized Zn finger protein (UPF0148 family)
MYCDRCGTPFGAGATYCSSCGKQIVAGAAAFGLKAAGFDFSLLPL